MPDLTIQLSETSARRLAALARERGETAEALALRLLEAEICREAFFGRISERGDPEDFEIGSIEWIEAAIDHGRA